MILVYESFFLEDGYFQTELNRCYCETCHKVRGDEPYFKRGEPPKDCALPFGWCKFALKYVLISFEVKISENKINMMYFV